MPAGRRALKTLAALPTRPGAGSWITVSTSVFHSPQSGHLPCHLAWLLPQTEQT